MLFYVYTCVCMYLSLSLYIYIYIYICVYTYAHRYVYIHHILDVDDRLASPGLLLLVPHQARDVRQLDLDVLDDQVVHAHWQVEPA